MTPRQQRLAALRQIIITQVPCSQDELRVALAAQGYFISQPQLSKDLSRVHAYKVEGHYIIVEDTRFKRLP